MKLATGWFLAAVPDGLLCAGGHAALEVDLEQAAAERLVVAATAGPLDARTVAKAAGVALVDATLLLARLSDIGALEELDGEASSVAALTPAIDALIGALAGHELATRVVTADELLAAPTGIDGRAARRTLRAFLSGFASRERLRAYAHAALAGRKTVAGDHPEPAAAARGLELLADLDPAAIHTVELVSGVVHSVLPEDLDTIGAGSVHRLGTAVAARSVGPPPPGAPALHICMVRQARPNLRFPGSDHGHATGISADPDQAQLIARAEAAERFACGDLTDRVLVRATQEELDAPFVAPDALVRYSARQRAEGVVAREHRSDDRRLWTPGSLAGERHWLPAEMVFSPFADPESPAPLPALTSSGCAAHSTFDEARRRAIAELVERDAFMWHWVQRVGRERLDPVSLPPRLREELDDLRAAGHAVDLVNLTLDVKPVIFCAIRTSDVLSVAASCRDDPADAAGRALREAATLLWSRPEAVPLVRDWPAVRTPLDHLGVYRDAGARDEAAFLWSGDETIPLADVQAAPGPIDEAVRVVGEPIAVDLTSPGSQPFFVARAFVPGLVPLSFGFDREPLGIDRLGTSIELHDGRRLDATREPGRLGPLPPHPFP